MADPIVHSTRAARDHHDLVQLVAIVTAACISPRRSSGTPVAAIAIRKRHLLHVGASQPRMPRCHLISETL